MSATQILNDSQIVDKEVGKVYYTNDLSLFKFMEGNRTPNPSHIAKIAKSMEQIGLLMNPIIINSDLEVIDGQHRFLAAKEVGSGIYYIIAEDYKIKEVHALNVNQKQWSTKDFIEGYADMGIKDYSLLKEYMDKYPFLPTTVCFEIAISNSGWAGNSSSSVKEGSFKFKRNWDEACYIANSIKEIKKYFEDAYKKSFVAAIVGAYNKDIFDMESFIYKCKKYPTKIYNCAKQSEFTQMIESVYNYRNHNKVSLRY
jgi:hypothetical protein